MNMYEIIIEILEKKGPVSFHSICQELNETEYIIEKRKKPVHISQIKSVVNRKKDLFSVQDDIVSIREEKQLKSLSVRMGSYPGPQYQLEVDFVHKRFYFFEWYIDSPVQQRKENSIYIGDIEEFKKEILRLKIWDWERDYQPDELILDGVNWKVKLRTKGRLYESEGLQAFPHNWSRFTRAMTKLIGVKF